jgi:TIR domain/Tetratricopeptide repeat
MLGDVEAGVGFQAGAEQPGAGVDFFISYAGPDRAWAEWVAWHLREAGYTVEVAAWDWAAGENFVARMHAAVDAASRVIALLSSAYFAADRYTADEWSAALVKDERTGGHRLVPVQIERCPLPLLLRPLLRVELFDVPEPEAVRRLLVAVRGPQRPDGAPLFPGRGTAGALTSRGENGPRLPGRLPVVWNVGPRNPGFVGRDAALVAVRERLQSAAAQALHGLGGVGKTQFAVEYAYRYADGYDLVWWVNAEQPDLIGDQYAALAGQLGLVGPHADTASSVSALCGYLRGHGGWLLVLDNAESPADIRGWLLSGPGHVLITSRNPGWGELAARVEVDVLPRADSVALLRTHRPDLAESEADQLATALGDLPLGLAQAGGFLAETGMPAAQYLNLLATRAGELLDQSPPDAHPHSLAAAVRLSTDRLAEIDPAALALARIGAFLAPEPIPAEVLTAAVALDDGVRPSELDALTVVAASPVAAHRSLGRVGRYGLGRVEDGLRLHRLTQAVLRDQLDAGQAAAYRDYAQALLVDADPGNERNPAKWPGWARMLPHLLATDPASSPNPALRDLAHRAAFYLYNRGENQLARQLAEDLYLAWRHSLGPDDQHTLRIGSLLGYILSALGLLKRACELGADTLARFQRLLGHNHPDTLLAAHWLGHSLHEAGAVEQACQLNKDTFARRRQVLGDHQDCEFTAHNLAKDLRELGDVEAAQRLQEDTVAYRRQVFGDDHPLTINATNELGATLRVLGQVEAARRLHQTNVAHGRRVLGEDHPWAMDSKKHLASDLHALGDFDAARRLSEDTLTRARRVLGDDSRFAIDAANNLAADLHALGEHELARRLSEDTFDRARRVLGDAHPLTQRAAASLTAIRHARQ